MYRRGAPPQSTQLWPASRVDALLASASLELPSDTTPVRLAQLVEHPAFERVVEIRTSPRIAADLDVDRLVDALHRSALRALDLRFLELGDDAIARIAETPLDTLESLDVGAHFVRAPLTDYGLDAVLRGAPKLRHLGLHRAHPSHGGLEAFLTSPRVDALESLHLDFARIALSAPPHGDWLAAFAGRDAPTALLQLALHSCNLLGYDVARLAQSTRLGGLRVLDLSDNLLDAAGIEALATSTSLASLEELVLHRMAFERACVQPLVRRTGLPALRRLGIAHTIVMQNDEPPLNSVGELGATTHSMGVDRTRQLFLAAGSTLEIF